jgi:hypothetical protein
MGKKSPFPEDFLGVDLFYDDGWQPVGDDLDQSGVRISHGARSEAGRPDASSMTFTVTNHDGQYSPRNPNSPLYGLVGRNTPVRARVDLGAPWLDLEAAGARAEAATDGTWPSGDLDVRWWGTRDEWREGADLLTRWDETNGSWQLRAQPTRQLTLFWTPDNSAVHQVDSQIGLPNWARTIAVRAVLDVNNGGGGHTVYFWYGPTLDGPWTPLGDPVVGSGTTSLYTTGSPGALIGKDPTSSAAQTPQRIYGWQIRSGMNGTLVSSATTANLAVGATSFQDDQGRTWTVTDGDVSNTHVLAVAEVAEWPVDWNTKGAQSVLTQVQAAGVTRRLGQGAQAVESVLYRTISGLSGLLGYWPMEDGSDATSFGAAVGTRRGAFSQPDLVRPAAYDSFPGSAPLPTLNAGRIRVPVDNAASTGEVQVRWAQRIPSGSLPSSTIVLARVEFSTGTIGHAELCVRDSDGSWGLFGFDTDGDQISGSTYSTGTDWRGRQMRMSLEFDQSGSNVIARRVALEPGAGAAVTSSITFTGHTVGRVSQVIFNPQFASLSNFAVGHLTIERQITSIFDVFGQPLVGYRGETAGNRMVRLAAENGAALALHGRTTAALGEQQEETLLDLLAEAADADGGVLYDDPHRLGLRYRNLLSMCSQPPVVIPYQDNLVIPFIPNDDDTLTRNRVTIARPDGTRITQELTTGRMSLQPPPSGVGLYDESLTLNLDTDDLVDRTAAWRMHIGTWDETRYPSLGVDLADPRIMADPVLTRQLLDLTVGDRLVITDPPSWLPPRAVDVLVRGIQYTVTPHSFQLRWTCVPARPYWAGYWNAGHRWSGSGTVTSGSLSTSTTSVTVTPPTGVAWTHADGDYDIEIGGEIMTVTAVAGNTLTVTRSVNGVIKTHPAGSAVELAEPSFYGR